MKFDASFNFYLKHVSNVMIFCHERNKPGHRMPDDYPTNETILQVLQKFVKWMEI